MGDDVRVLVVDDSEDFALAMAGMLELDGYVVQVAIDGAQALDAMATFQPHCVLFDIDMPGVDGAQLSRMLRERFEDDVILIAMTGSDASDRRVLETFERVDHYLQKPIDPRVLQRVLRPLQP